MCGGSGHRAASARTSASTCGNVGRTAVERPDRLAQQRQARRRNRPSAGGSPSGASPGKTTISGGAAARRRRLRRVGAQFAETLDQRMADIKAARAAEPPVGLRLERQQRQHAIDIGAHRFGAAGPPRPDARADVVDDRQFRQRRAPGRATRWVKSGLSMMTSASGARGDDRLAPSPGCARGASAAGRSPAECPSPRCRRSGTGSAGPRPPSPRRRCRRTRRRPPRASRSARISLKPSWSPECSPATRTTRNGVIGRAHVSNPKTNRPAASASRAQRSRSAIEHAAGGQRRRPRSCALAAPSIVFGPTAGMSSRRSCPRLGALTSTPARPRKAQAAAGAQFGDAREHRVGPFGRLDRQNAPAATTAPCPASNVDSAPISGRRARCRLRPAATAARAPNGPAGASSRGAISWAPTTRTPSLSKIARNADEEPVVAAAKQLREPRHPLHRAPVEPEVGEFGSGHRADDHHLGDARALQRVEQLADFAHAHPDVRVRLDRRSAAPTTPIKKRLPAARRASPATSSGNSPAPHRIARGGAAARGAPAPLTPLFLAGARHADRAFAALAQKVDDLLAPPPGRRTPPRRRRRAPSVCPPPRTASCRRGAARGSPRAKSRAASGRRH